MKKQDNIKIEGYKGTWYVVDKTIYNGKRYYLLESEIWGDEAPCLIIDEKGNVILDEVWNGFGDLYEAFED